jgi:hypothetical protein
MLQRVTDMNLPVLLHKEAEILDDLELPATKPKGMTERREKENEAKTKKTRGAEKTGGLIDTTETTGTMDQTKEEEEELQVLEAMTPGITIVGEMADLGTEITTGAVMIIPIIGETIIGEIMVGITRQKRQSNRNPII